MINGKGRIGEILRELLLGDKLPVLESRLLDEMEKEARSNLDNQFEPDKRELLDLLRRERESTLARRERLGNLNSFNSFGEYLRLLLEELGINVSEAARKFQVEERFLDELLQSQVAIINIAPDKLARVSKRCSLEIGQAKQLIRKTATLGAMGSPEQGANARYSPRSGLEEKDKSMSDGVKELLFKASQKRPFQSKLDKRVLLMLEDYLVQFEKAYEAV